MCGRQGGPVAVAMVPVTGHVAIMIGAEHAETGGETGELHAHLHSLALPQHAYLLAKPFNGAGQVIRSRGHSKAANDRQRGCLNEFAVAGVTVAGVGGGRRAWWEWTSGPSDERAEEWEIGPISPTTKKCRTVPLPRVNEVQGDRVALAFEV